MKLLFRALPLWVVAALMALPLSWLVPPIAHLAGPSPAGAQSRLEAELEALVRPGEKSVKVQIRETQAKIQEIESTEELDEGSKKKLLSIYNQTLAALSSAEQYATSTEAFQRAVDTAPGEIQRLREQIETLKKQPLGPKDFDVSKLSVSELSRRVTSVQLESAIIKEDVSFLDSLLQEKRGRPSQARERILVVKSDLQSIANQITSLDLSREMPQMIEARRSALEARRQAGLKEITMLNMELLAHGTTLQLLENYRTLRELNLERLESMAGILGKELAKRQSEEVHAEARKDTTKLPGYEHEVVKTAAAKNARLEAALRSVVDRNERSMTEVNSMRSKLRQIEQAASDIKQKLSVAGLSKAIGPILVEELRKLPPARTFAERASSVKGKIRDVWFDLVSHDESKKSSSEVQNEIEALMREQVDESLPEGDRRAVEKELSRLLHDREKILSALVDAEFNFIGTLGEIENMATQLEERTAEYRNLIKKFVLWVPLSQPIWRTTLQGITKLAPVLVSRAGWQEVFSALTGEMKRSLHLAAIVIALIVTLLMIRGLLDTFLKRLNDKVRTDEADRFRYTPAAFLVTGLKAAPLPLIFWFLSSRLKLAGEDILFAKFVGIALGATILPLLYLRILYHFCAPQGVAASHLLWARNTVKILRRHVTWFTFIFIPMIFFIVLSWQFEEFYRSRVVMIAFALIMLAVSFFFLRVLNPSRGAPAHYLKENPEGLLSHTAIVWYPLGVITPLLLIALGISGYSYSAMILASLLIQSFWLIAGAIIVHSLISRWLRVAQRNLERADVVRDQAASTAGLEPQGSEENTRSHKVRFTQVESMKLGHFFITITLIIGFLLIWSDLFPAIAFFDKFTLWHYTATVDGAETAVPVTLTDLFVALLILTGMIAILRRLSGLVQIVSAGWREAGEGNIIAITHIIKYTIISIGSIAIIWVMGGRWSQVQWMVAALGVGLGFGLQEIVSNFFSGLILLFERPIRVGDIVTVGDVSGRVTDIRIRATTITDFDNKELIVPNKNFITGELVNWTLTDPITRLTIDIGIAYGSDTAAAHKIMLETVTRHPLVLFNPSPRVFFTEFGDSSLNFKIFVYIRDIRRRMELLHDLHMSIDRALRENGIEIPFPQRDIHVRTLPPDAQKGGGSGEEHREG